MLSTASANALTALFSSAYVGSLYLSRHARLVFSPSPSAVRTPRSKTPDERWRDDPDVIKARLTAVCLATAACCAIVLKIHTSALPESEQVCLLTSSRASVSLSSQSAPLSPFA